MDYKTADLSFEEVQQLQQLEQELSEKSGDEIVLIAYKPETGTKKE